MKIGLNVSTRIAAHAALTATHGVSGTIADAATLTTHAAKKTGTHGVGSKYIALATDSTQKVANADIKALAGIAYSKLALTGLIRDADIKSDAAIAISKLVAAVCSETEADGKISDHAGVAGAHHAKTLITDGSYNGDDSVHRAIPHGLGRLPNLVAIMCTTKDRMLWLIYNKVLIDMGGSFATDSVTAWTTTNFYIGNGGAQHYGNSTGDSYKWIAV